MKTKSMTLTFAVCVAGLFAVGAASAQAAALTLRPATGHAAAPAAKKAPKPKEYTMCLNGGCNTLYVYTKSKRWEYVGECWLYEGEECPGLGWIKGGYVKEAKGKVTYIIEGPFAGEPEDGRIEVTKVKKSSPAKYAGAWFIFGEDEGEATVEV